MLESIINQYDFNLKWAGVLVEDLNNQQMTASPGPGLENHPAFTLGHLATASALLAARMARPLERPPSLENELPAGWPELFQRKGPGDPRLPEVSPEAYPAKTELLEVLYAQHEKVKRLLSGLTTEKLSEPVTWRFSIYFPSLLDLIQFMCVSHESMHLGQLSAWRRAMKLPSALVKL